MMNGQPSTEAMMHDAMQNIAQIAAGLAAHQFAVLGMTTALLLTLAWAAAGMASLSVLPSGRNKK